MTASAEDTGDSSERHGFHVSDEAVLLRAWQRLQELTVQLEVAPFTQRTTQSLLQYVLEDAGPALAAWKRWAARSGGPSLLGRGGRA